MVGELDGRLVGFKDGAAAEINLSRAERHVRVGHHGCHSERHRSSLGRG